MSSSEMEAFNNRKYIPGQYLIDVFINNEGVGRQLLKITSNDKDALCFPIRWLEKTNIRINTSFYNDVFNQDRNCYVLSKNKDTKVNFDFSSQSLSFSIPQKGLVKKNDVIKDWNYGIPALRLDYNINSNINNNDYGLFASSNITLNAGKWLVTTSANVTKNTIDIPIASASRALHGLEANLVLGRAFVNDSIAGGVSILGIGINSDNSMSPDEYGYSPVFSGVARTHARVSLVQNGNVVYSEMVPPGPFEVTDATLLGSGDVTMFITETDGKVSTHIFPLTTIPSMLTPGQLEYGFAAGVSDSRNEHISGGVGVASAGYGFNNFTLKGSTVLHSKYFNGGISLARGFGSFGAMSFSGAYSHSVYDDNSEKSGARLDITYAKQFDEGTTLQLSGTRYNNKNFTEFSSFYPDNSSYFSQRQKYDYNFNISHYLSDNMSFGVSGWVRDYWDINGKSLGFTGRMRIKFDSFSLALGSSYSSSSVNDGYSLSVSASIPLTFMDNDYNGYSGVSLVNGSDASYNAGVSTSVKNWSYSINSGWNDDGNAIYSFSSGYQGDRASVNGEVSQSAGNTTGSISLAGSVIVLPTEKDLIFTRNLTDTIAIANVKDTAGVRFLSSPYPTNSKGNAVIPISSYNINSITLDGSSLPIDTELLTTDQEVIPTRGAVVYIPFGAVKVKRYLLQIQDAHGEFVPNGTWASSLDGTPLGFIVQNGVLFISSITKPKGIKLGDCIIGSDKIIETEKLQKLTCKSK